MWEPGRGGPLCLVAGGSGIAPLMAMLRSRVAARSDVPVRTLCSWRSADDIIYADELAAIAREDEGVSITHTLTRSAPEGWTGPTGPIRRRVPLEPRLAARGQPLTYVCGPTGFVEAVASAWSRSATTPARILTERFGPTGG